MDTIFINDLEVHCIIGVYEWERQVTQKLRISIEVECDLRQSGTSDTLKDTVSYADIAVSIESIAVEGQFQLVEALAESIAQKLLTMPGVDRCTVVISKPGAVRPARDCGVRIQRP